MLKRTQLMASAALMLALSAPAHAENGADAVMATVNGVDITMGHMIVVRSGLPEQYRDLPDDVLFTGILDQLIQQAVLAQAAGEETPTRVQLALENERRSLMAAEHMDGVLENAVTEDDAKALITELEGGADFAELAKEKSTGPSGPRGGALGWFGKGMMVPEFETAVADMEVGAISAPIKTQFGWHVIKLNNARTKDAPKMEDVRAELEQQVRMDKVESYISELTDKATISRKTGAEVDTSQLKDLTLLEN